MDLTSSLVAAGLGLAGGLLAGHVLYVAIVSLSGFLAGVLV